MSRVTAKLTGAGGAVWRTLNSLESTPGVLSGHFCLKGTRIPLYLLLESIDENELAATMNVDPQKIIAARDELVNLFAARPRELEELS